MTAPDLLELLFERQADLMPILGVEMPDPSAITSDKMFFPILIGVSTEAAEVLDRAAVINKPWKITDQATILEGVIEESIDVLFMLLEAWIFLGLDANQIVDRYMLKYETNLTRVIISQTASDDQKREAIDLLRALMNA